MNKIAVKRGSGGHWDDLILSFQEVFQVIMI